jgi:hypothetical protein
VPCSDPQDGAKALPVVLWHGMGDSCCAAGGMGAVKQLIEDELGGCRGGRWGCHTATHTSPADRPLACERARPSAPARRGGSRAGTGPFYLALQPWPWRAVRAPTHPPPPPDTVSGVFVHSIATGEGEYHDIWSSFMGNVNAQVR